MERLGRIIRYRGPLGRQCYLKLDIADDELVLYANNVNSLRRWDDLPETGSASLTW